ncbi:MAG: corrinoid protein [Deltaproteobacteria bacterium]|jgi:corrinoid protein of di/trimethylamine methyltransferase|nr:corrinoid protein [Deltaproteobacteria bacterium]
MPEEKKLHLGLAEAVAGMDEKGARELSVAVVDGGYDAYAAIDNGLARGMGRAGQLFEEDEYFVPELLICSDAMYAGLDVLKPHIIKKTQDKPVKFVLGVVEGDTHDIGKNLVKIMLDAAGFEIHDLGRDVPAHRFVEKAVEVGADFIGMSTLMTTTMGVMNDVVKLLTTEKLRDRFIVMVGGGPISAAFAEKIKADAYSSNAADAVRVAKRLAGLAETERADQRAV